MILSPLHRAPALEAISPELALVDPVLAHAARRRLPDLPGPTARPRGRLYRAPLLAVGAGVAVLALGSASFPRSTPTAPPTASPQVVGAAGQTFAWAPDPHASAYEFQLFRGAEPVYRVRAAEPRVHVDGRHLGRPGTYRWYVWAVEGAGAKVAAEATVSATMTIRRASP